MRSITVEALWGNDSKCLWCSRNIHVSSALQNPIGLAAFEERQMNNQKGEEGGSNARGALVEKKVKKRSSLCSAGSLKSFLQQTLVYRHTQRHTGSLSLSSSVFSLSLSPSLLFHLLHIPSSLPSVCSRDPPCPPVLTTRLLSRLWYLFAKRSTAYFGSISPATTALITATKPRLFNCTDSHLFVIHSHYHFPKALKHMHAELTSWFL